MKIAELTSFELEEIKNEAIVICGIAPIEQHGKHLPIGTDYYLTKRWIDDTIQLLEHEEKYSIFELPILPFGCSDIKALSGNLYITQNQIYQLVYELISNIASWGIKNIIIISAHADPKHQIAIEEACGKLNKKYGKVAFSPMGAILSAEDAGMKIEQSENVDVMLNKFPNDFHAGWIETSLMLYYEKHLVKKDYIYSKETLILPKEMILPKKVNKKIATVGHIGNPKESNEKLGEELHISMVKEISKAIKIFVERNEYERYEHHFLYKFPFMRVNKFRRY